MDKSWTKKFDISDSESYIKELEHKLQTVSTLYQKEVRANTVIKSAIVKLLRTELDNVDVHPCDVDNDDIRSEFLNPELKKLYDFILFTDVAKTLLW